MLNTDSVTTTPLISSATPTPTTVAMGTAALRSAWQHAGLGQALGRAVRMKSSPMTSMTLVRVMRAISAT